MSQPCPICGRPVDPLRAPAVRVRGGKVIGFCSAECARAGETQPTAMPVTPVAAPDSGPVIEIIREPASGVVTSARDERVPSSPKVPTLPAAVAAKPKPNPKAQDDTLDKWTVGDDDSALRSTPMSTTSPGARGRSKAPLIVALVVIVGAGAFLAYRFLIVKSDAGASVAPPPARPAPIAAVPDAAIVEAPTAGKTLAQAREVLVHHMQSASPRVQRVAAAALARTRDPQAIAALADLLAHEGSDVAKLELAYALARAGDKRGGDALASASTAGRSRDVRAEGSRLLALLGDPRAIPTLASYLDVTQLRLGAAEQLAYLAEPRALKALDALRADPKTSADDQARATIALGVAGRTDVTPALRALLGDARFNAFAATALAQLHDAAARPVLVKHLEIPSLRVGAARALRRLDPALDPAPLLPPLVAQLASAKDTEQVQVAEAILLLVGPADWSLRP